MDVSVVIPTRERPRLLERAIKSIHGQSLKPASVIIVEDGGYTRETQEVVNQFLDTVPILHLQSHGGACAARNAGLASVATQFVAFLDDDDWWDRNFLSVCIDRLRESLAHTYALTGRVYTHDTGVSIARDMPEQDFQKGLLNNLGFGGTNGVFSCDDVRQVGGWDESLVALQDRDLQLRLLVGGCKAVFIHEPLAYKDSAHGHPRITTSNRRAEGSLQFFRKWQRSATPVIRARMLYNVWCEQRTANNPMRRVAGLLIWKISEFPRKVVIKVKLVAADALSSLRVTEKN